MEVLNRVLNTKQEFAEYFESIPEEMIIGRELTRIKNGKECHCALGWMGVIEDDKGRYHSPNETTRKNVFNLARMIDDRIVIKNEFDVIWKLNDGIYDATPKIKILNALK